MRVAKTLLVLGLCLAPTVPSGRAANEPCDALAGQDLPEHFSPGRESFFKRVCSGDPTVSSSTRGATIESSNAATFDVVTAGDAFRDLSITGNILVNTRGDTFPHTTESETSIDTFDGDGDGLAEQVVMAWNGVVGSNHGLGVGFSVDRGDTWTDLGLLPNPSGFSNCCDPAVGVNSTGTFYITVLTCGSGVCQLGLSSMVPPAPPTVPVIIPGLVDVDREDMAVDDTGDPDTEGNIYVCYAEFGVAGVPIRLVRSTDGGGTWSTPINLGFGQACRLEVGAGGEVFAAWHRTTAGPNDLAEMHIRKCTPGATECGVLAEWSADMTIDTVTRAQNTAAAANCGRPALNGNVRKTFENPTLAINRASGRVHVAYSFKTAVDAADDADIRYQALNPDLTVAIAPKTLNVDGTSTDQWRPFLSVTTGASPALAVAWYSRQFDTTNNLNFDVIKRISMDDGATFGTEERITTASSPIPTLNPNFDPDIANCYMSDYETMDADDSSWFIGWSDNRLTANSTPDPDIRFARETLGDPPEARCRDVSKPADASCLAAVTPEEVDDGSFDPDGGPVTLDLSPEGPFMLGATPVTLTVTDDEGVAMSCSATVTVTDETPPDLVPVSDVSAECSTEGGSIVDYTEPAATDNCDPAPTVSCSPPSGSFFPLGETLVTCTATDASGNVSSPTSFNVNVVDTTPPVIEELAASPHVLWPPNHKMVPVTVSASATDVCDPTPVCQIVSIDSNEPVNGRGDGNTAPDWEITGPLTANLRSERAGRGVGRIYTINVECMDGSGNVAAGQVPVVVPHDRR